MINVIFLLYVDICSFMIIISESKITNRINNIHNPYIHNIHNFFWLEDIRQSLVSGLYIRQCFKNSSLSHLSVSLYTLLIHDFLFQVHRSLCYQDGSTSNSRTFAIFHTLYTFRESFN